MSTNEPINPSDRKIESDSPLLEEVTLDTGEASTGKNLSNGFKIELPKFLAELKNERGGPKFDFKKLLAFWQNHHGFLYTEDQKKAIYQAKKDNPDLVKIRRVWTSSPESNQKTKRKNITANKLEETLDLEFSIIFDDNQEPIALFRGKDYLLGEVDKTIKEKDKIKEIDRRVRVKMGQRLSDGKLVAVKIMKNPKLNKRSTKITKKVGQLYGTAVNKNDTTATVTAFEIQRFIQGPNLIAYCKDRLSGIDNSSPDVNLNIAVSILEELTALHKNNIVHADIKPENIIYLRDHNPPKVEIVDYEYSFELKPGDTPLYLAEQLGTSIYNAPETILQSLYSFKSDVYTTALTFDLLHLRQSIEPSLLTEYDALIASMRETDPKNRISSAEALSRMKVIAQKNHALLNDSLYFRVLSSSSNFSELDKMITTGEIDKNILLLYLLRGKKHVPALALLEKYNLKDPENEDGFDITAVDQDRNNMIMLMFLQDLDTLINHLTRNLSTRNLIINFFKNKDNIKKLIKDAKIKKNPHAANRMFKRMLDAFKTRLAINIPLFDIILSISNEDPKFLIDHFLLIVRFYLTESKDKDELLNIALNLAKTHSIPMPQALTFIKESSQSKNLQWLLNTYQKYNLVIIKEKFSELIPIEEFKGQLISLLTSDPDYVNKNRETIRELLPSFGPDFTEADFFKILGDHDLKQLGDKMSDLTTDLSTTAKSSLKIEQMSPSVSMATLPMYKRESDQSKENDQEKDKDSEPSANAGSKDRKND